jgi:hypothetical protein
LRFSWIPCGHFLMYADRLFEGAVHFEGEDNDSDSPTMTITGLEDLFSWVVLQIEFFGSSMIVSSCNMRNMCNLEFRRTYRYGHLEIHSSFMFAYRFSAHICDAIHSGDSFVSSSSTVLSSTYDIH